MLCLLCSQPSRCKGGKSDLRPVCSLRFDQKYQICENIFRCNLLKLATSLVPLTSCGSSKSVTSRALHTRTSTTSMITTTKDYRDKERTKRMTTTTCIPLRYICGDILSPFLFTKKIPSFTVKNGPGKWTPKRAKIASYVVLESSFPPETRKNAVGDKLKFLCLQLAAKNAVSEVLGDNISGFFPPTSRKRICHLKSTRFWTFKIFKISINNFWDPFQVTDSSGEMSTHALTELPNR